MGEHGHSSWYGGCHQSPLGVRVCATFGFWQIHAALTTYLVDVSLSNHFSSLAREALMFLFMLKLSPTIFLSIIRIYFRLKKSQRNMSLHFCPSSKKEGDPFFQLWLKTYYTIFTTLQWKITGPHTTSTPSISLIFWQETITISDGNAQSRFLWVRPTYVTISFSYSRINHQIQDILPMGIIVPLTKAFDNTITQSSGP